MDGFTSTSASPPVKNQGIGRISDKRKISVSWKVKMQLAMQVLLQHYTSGVIACVWDVLCHLLSRAEEVMRECDIHHTRAIKTNSAVNLSRKPGLDLCCDLLQHLQGVPRTCSFYIIIRTSILLVPSLLKLSFIWNVTRSNSRIIWMAFFAQFCFILFNT